MFKAVLGLIIVFAILIMAMYKGFSPIFVTPACVLALCFFENLNPTETVFVTYALGTSNVMQKALFMFLLSYIFGEIMIKTGASHSIAEWISRFFGIKHCVWAMITATGVLTYGGLGFGAYITMYPICLLLCKKANFSKHIIVAAIVSGAWTFSMSTPFAPTLTNISVMKNLGTSSGAGLIPGLAAGIFMFVLCSSYCDYQAKAWQRKGKVFEAFDELGSKNVPSGKFPGILISITPIIVTIVIFNVIKAEIGTALFAGSATALILMHKSFPFKEWLKTINSGAKLCVEPLFCYSMMGGFGAVLAKTEIFSVLSAYAQNSHMHPYLITIFISQAMSFCLGSTSNSALMVSGTFYDMFKGFSAAGYNLGVIHRLISLSTASMHIVPHNGSLVSINMICKTSYKNTFWTTYIAGALIPTICLFAIALPLALMGFS
ncbi:MAG: SLC13 family permease [Lachnospiraceae bacterium]|nr:SLC13 family permease [Lachnospiraceae bacterium]